MATQTKEERLRAVHERALRRFDTIQAGCRDERMQCLEDRRFYSISGAQWEGPLGDQFENKPRFEMNKVHLAVIRIINEWRNNRITVNFSPKDGDTDQLSDTLAGLYRADEEDSCGEEAFDNGFEEGAGGGMGSWRLRARYEEELDDDDDRQRVGLEPIFDADSCVFWDPNSKRQDKSDAKYCFVLTSMTHEAYKEEYGDSPASWPKDITQSYFDWCTNDVLYIAEYYEIEEKSVLLHVFRGLTLDDDEPNELKYTDAELDEERLATLQATGFREVRQKRIKRIKVHKYELSGARVEEDCGYIAGSMIPIVTVFGKRWVVDGIERCMGHVRLAKDMQRLMNSLLSWLGDIAARFDVEKPILTPEQIIGHTEMWAQDNVKRFPYLLVNPMKDAAGQVIAGTQLGYTKAPMIPPAMAALVGIASQALEDMLGNQQAGEKMVSNISEKTVEMIQSRLDMQAFIYMSNMAKAVKRTGEIWLSMMKDIVVEEGRKMKTVSAEGKVGSVELMRPMIDKETKEQYLENDIGSGKMDVRVTVGPSSASKRSATVRSLMAVLAVTEDPQDRKVISSMIMMNMEGEGMQDARDYFRQQLVRLGAVKPTEEEKKKIGEEMANQPPDANAQFLQASAAEAAAQAGKAESESILNAAKTDESRAKAVKTLAEADALETNTTLDVTAALSEALRNAGGIPDDLPAA